MNHFMVQLHSMEDIKQFIDIATAQPCAVQVSSGTQTANAKSFMGMFTLDYAQPLLVSAGGTEEQLDLFRQAVCKYIVTMGT